MSAIRVTVRAPRTELGHWLTMGGFSVFLHAATFAAVLFAPQFFRPQVKFPEVYTVDLVSLPAGDPGPPAEGPRASAPAQAPAPVPAPPEPAVKIPEKPQAVLPKPKPVPKKEPSKPKAEKIEKVEKKEKPAPKPRATAPEPSKPVESGNSSQEGTANAKSAGSAPTGTSASTGGGPGIPGATGPGGAGGSGFLDDATFEYGWYLSNMSSILGRNWARPLKPDLNRTLRAVIHFKVLKDGTLSDIDLEQSSGDAALDRSALRAVQDSNPLPPLPFQYGKESLGVHFFFDLKPD